MARVWQLASRPTGVPRADNFKLVEVELRPLQDGEVRVRNRWLSVDAAMRPLMDKVESGPSLEIGAALPGSSIGEVIESRNELLACGDKVLHTFGWRDEAQGRAKFFTKVADDVEIPEHFWLGNLGMSGATAYFGLLHVAGAKAGDTVFVSAAAGAVGSAVVQIAAAKNLTVIGSAGGGEKCDLVRKLGAAVAIDYKAPGSLLDKLKQAAPEGIDVYFDNVGADHLDAALACARPGARFAECGMIQGYNSDARQTAVGLHHLMKIVAARVAIKGFVVFDFAARMDEFRRDMMAWVREGRIKSCETVLAGLDATPEAFIGLFSGNNVGKMLLKL
jgi:NADPH-dependent curcumin reductase CurA